MKTFLRQCGGYKSLRVYKISEIIYDVTFYFSHNYLPHGDRTIDQMIQAARSGKQNIAEGSEAATTSRETEIKLTNVAKASLEELLIDYQDFLRVRNINVWDISNPRLQRLRKYLTTETFNKEYPQLLTKLNSEEIANLAITLINQATYMLRRLLERQQETFVENGGIREQMAQARIKYRNSQNS